MATKKKTAGVKRIITSKEHPAPLVEPPVDLPSPPVKPRFVIDGGSVWIVFGLLAVGLVVSNLMLQDRIDGISTKIAFNEQWCQAYAQNTIHAVAAAATNTTEPFCYGVDSNGNMGYAIDSRKVTIPCQGFENLTKK